MIEFRTLADDHADVPHSPLLQAALLTLQYTQAHGAVGLTKTKAFKRVFVRRAVMHFDWPGSSAEEMVRYNKVINEYEFPPLELLHYLLITLRLGGHFKGKSRLTKRGTELAQAPGKLFVELVPFFVLQIDHASYGRVEDRPFGKWEVWIDVFNVEADHGTNEWKLFAAFSMARNMIRTMLDGAKWLRSPPVFYVRMNGQGCSCRLVKNAGPNMCTKSSRRRSSAALCGWTPMR